MKKGERNLIRDILSIYAPTFFIVTGLSIVSPILPICAESFGVCYALATLAISIYAVARLLFNIPIRLLGDRFGRRPLPLLGALTVALSAFLCAYTVSGSCCSTDLFRCGLHHVADYAGNHAPRYSETRGKRQSPWILSSFHADRKFSRTLNWRSSCRELGARSSILSE